MRTLLAALAMILGVALLAACGGAESEEPDAAATTGASGATRLISQTGPDATASPEASPTPEATAPTPEAASPPPELVEAAPMTCVFPADTRSFRLSMAMETTDMDYGSLFGTAGGGGGGAAGGFLDLFDGFSDETTMEFTYVAPDRWSIVVFEDGEETCSYIVIGSQAWCKEAGSTDWVEEPASEEDLAFSTQDFCEIEDLLPSPGQVGEKETVNGIEAVHYQLSEEASTQWPAEDMEWESTYDVWLAEDGNWPVRVAYEVAYQAGLLEHYSMDMLWEISDLNDPSIVVESPTLR